jgi:hypothetical protein
MHRVAGCGSHAGKGLPETFAMGETCRHSMWIGTALDASLTHSLRSPPTLAGGPSGNCDVVNWMGVSPHPDSNASIALHLAPPNQSTPLPSPSLFTLPFSLYRLLHFTSIHFDHPLHIGYFTCRSPSPSPATALEYRDSPYWQWISLWRRVRTQRRVRLTMKRLLRSYRMFWMCMWPVWGFVSFLIIPSLFMGLLLGITLIPL